MSLRTKERRSRLTTAPRGAELPTVKWMAVTPELAETWLAKNHDRQRHIRLHKVGQYAGDMERGRWQLSDQCITFDVDKRLINGQTRLSAVVKSRKTQTMLVGFGFPADAFLTIDVGLKRNTDDAFRLAGRDYPAQCGATVRSIIAGTAGQRRAVTDQEIDEFMHTYGESVRFAHSVLFVGRGKTAQIRAVVARAHACRKPVSRLREYSHVIMTGLMSGVGDAAAVLFRNYLMDQHGETTNRGKLYRMAEASLFHFLKREQIADGKLMEAERELFHLAGEDLWTVDELVDPPANGKPR